MHYAENSYKAPVTILHKFQRTYSRLINITKYHIVLCTKFGTHIPVYCCKKYMPLDFFHSVRSCTCKTSRNIQSDNRLYRLFFYTGWDKEPQNKPLLKPICHKKPI